MTKFKRSNGEPVDLSHWTLPVIDKFTSSIGEEMLKALRDLIDGTADDGIDVYFTIGCPPPGETPNAMDITIGLPVGVPNNVEFRGSLLHAVKELVERGKGLTHREEILEYGEMLRRVSNAMKEVAELLDVGAGAILSNAKEIKHVDQ